MTQQFNTKINSNSFISQEHSVGESYIKLLHTDSEYSNDLMPLLNNNQIRYLTNIAETLCKKYNLDYPRHKDIRIALKLFTTQYVNHEIFQEYKLNVCKAILPFLSIKGGE